MTTLPWFDARAVRERTPMARLVAALRDAFAAGAQVPPRHVHAVGEDGTLLVMPAWREGARLGVKLVTVHPGNGARGLPAVHGVYALFDAATGVPLAMLDGSELTARRTAAASALAASFLARGDAAELLVVGAGRVAGLIPEAMRCVRPTLARVKVWNHRAAGAQRLAQALREEGVDAQALPDDAHALEAAVRGADIVSCATLASAPLVRGEWLAAGAHLDLIGSFTPAMREADAECFARCEVWVDTEEALAKSGDVLQALAEGGFERARLRGTLATLVRMPGPARVDARALTLFKSVGNAVEDLAAAELVHGVAR